MKLTRIAFVLLCSIGLSLACGDTDSTGPNGDLEITDVSVNDIVGTWEFTTMEYIDQADTTRKVDEIDSGVAGTFTVTSNGSFAVVLVLPSESMVVDIITGSISAQDGDLLISDDGGDDITFSAVLSGEELEITAESQEYDFDDNGVDEAATQRIVLQKVSGITAADLEGTWTTTEFRFISATQTDTIDAIAGGGSVTADFSLPASYSAEVEFPGDPLQTDSGAFYIGDSGLWLIETADPDSPTIFTSVELSGSTLTLVGADEMDFDDNGTSEPATLEVVFEKQ